MPRILVLVFFLAMCCTAFMASNLFAGESDTSTQKLRAPHDSLATLLKTAHKKSSTDTQLSSTKRHSKVKSAHKAKSSKKFASGKKTKKSQYARSHHKKHSKAYMKGKHHKKSYKQKTRTARKSL